MVRSSLTPYDRAAQSRNKISAAAASAITTIAFIPIPPHRSSSFIVTYATSRG
jgi:hypothetical protein